MKLGGILGKSKDFREVWVLTQPLKTSRGFQLKFKISRGSNFAEDISSGTFFPNDPNRPCGGESEPGGGNRGAPFRAEQICDFSRCSFHPGVLGLHLPLGSPLERVVFPLKWGGPMAWALPMRPRILSNTALGTPISDIWNVI